MPLFSGTRHSQAQNRRGAALRKLSQGVKMHFIGQIISPELVERVIDSIPSRTHGIHGLPHWIRVERNGLELAAAEGGDPEVVSLFALFHDSRRINDDADPEHGIRGARLAEQLRAEGLFEVTDDQLQVLVYACENHTDVTYSKHPSVACCWDADRLDLTRIGIALDPQMLNTETARRGAGRSLAESEPMEENGQHGLLGVNVDNTVPFPESEMSAGYVPIAKKPHTAGWLIGAIVFSFPPIVPAAFVYSEWEEINEFTFMVTMIPALVALCLAALALGLWAVWIVQVIRSRLFLRRQLGRLA